jgi:hypothetical protein
MVLAGLDPAAGFVVKLMGLLQERIARAAAAAGNTADARLHLDEFLGVVCIFRQQPLEVLQHEQVQQAAAEAAAREAAAAAAEEHGEFDEQQQQQQHEGGQEEWQEHEEGGKTEADAAAEDAAEAEAGSEPAWGAAIDEDMLERHIEQHRSRGASAATAPATELRPVDSVVDGSVEPGAAETETAQTEVTEAAAAAAAAAAEPEEALPEPAAALELEAAAVAAAELGAAEQRAAEASCEAEHQPDNSSQLQQQEASDVADPGCCASEDACDAAAAEPECEVWEHSPANNDTAAGSQGIGSNVCSEGEEKAAVSDAETTAGGSDADTVNQEHDGCDESLQPEEGADAHAEDVGATGGEADEDAAARCFNDEAGDVEQESAAVMPEETAATAEVNAETGRSSEEEAACDTDA